MSFHFCKDCRIFCEGEWKKHVESSGPFGRVATIITSAIENADAAKMYPSSLLHNGSIVREKMICWTLALARKNMWWWIMAFSPIAFGQILAVNPIGHNLAISRNVFIVSKISFHFCKDCRIFCEGEWDNGNGAIKKYPPGTVSLASASLAFALLVFALLASVYIGLVGWIDLVYTGLVGRIDSIGPVDISEHLLAFASAALIYVGLLNLISISGISGLVGDINCISLSGIIGLVGDIDVFGIRVGLDSGFYPTWARLLVFAT